MPSNIKPEEHVFRPVGTMDKDSDLRYVKNGNFIDAQNIQHLGTGYNSDEFVYALGGNTEAFTLPTVAVQSKKYQVTISEPTGKSYQFTFLNLNGSSFPTPLVVSFTTTGNLATDTASLVALFLSTITGQGYTCTCTGSNGVIDVTLGTGLIGINGFDYIIEDTGTSLGNPTVISEAIDSSITGICLPIGGVDFLGDLHILSSSQQNEESTFNIINVTDSSGTINIVIAGDQSALFKSGYAVSVESAGGIPAANGTWLAESVTVSGGDTNILLYNSTYSGSFTSGDSISVYVYGFLAWTVHQFNPSTNAWTSTTLLETKALGYRFPNPLKRVLADKQNEILSLYFTNEVLPPRLLEYTGPYVTNGAIEPIVSTGKYFYDGIEISTNLLLSNAGATIQLISVLNSGGNVTTGNWRYAVRFLDSNLTPGAPSLLSNPVEIYTADKTQPQTVMGNTAGVVSDKQVQLQINDIPLNVYPYLQLIGVNYIGGSEIAYLIKQVIIPSGVTSVSVTHSGFETYTDFDAGNLTQTTATYDTVGDMEIIDNTLILARLSQNEIQDFSSWFQTFKHTIVKDTSALDPTGDDSVGYTLGDYQSPGAQFLYLGYPDNETVRFGGVVEFYDGTISSPYWIDDIRLDNFKQGGTTPFNQANPFNNNRRVASFSSYDLSATSNGGQSVLQDLNAYVTCVQFSGIDFTYLINGTPIYQLAKRIHIFRINNSDFGLNEVLGSGMLIRHAYGTGQPNVSSPNELTIYGTGSSPGNTNVAFDNPFILTSFHDYYYSVAGFTFPFADLGSNFCAQSLAFTTSGGTNNTYSYGAWTGGPSWTTNLPVDQYSASFYCMDEIFGQTEIAYESGDSIICYGQPDFRTTWANGSNNINETYSTIVNLPPVTNTAIYGVYLKMCGVTGQATEPTHNVLNRAQGVGDFAGLVNWTGHGTVTQYDTGINVNYDNTINYNWDTIGHLLINCQNPINQVNQNMWIGGQTTGAPLQGSLDLGCYYMQYYRDKGSLTAYSNAANYPANTKFGAINTGTYIPTGFYLDTSSNNNASLSVYGGDTYTQRCYLKTRYPINNTDSHDSNWTGSGITMSFFAQNRFNFNMRNATYTSDILNFPNADTNNWINLPDTWTENTNYDQGYTPRNIEDAESAFSSSLTIISKMGTRLANSLTKPQDSLINNYRIFPPLNFFDLTSSYGDITGIRNVDGKLVSWQPKYVQHVYYNEGGVLQSNKNASATDILLGSGSNWSVAPDPLSRHGCSNQFSILLGNGISGETIVAWIDILNKTALMISGNTIRNIGLEKSMRSWFFNQLTWCTADNPSLRTGITGVFDEKRKEFIWTMAGITSGLWTAYNPANTYTEGQLVSFDESFENFPLFWLATQDVPINEYPGPNSLYWIPDPNGSYSNYYSLAYNVIKDGFTSFYTPKPYMYFKWTDTYLSAYPLTSANSIWQADLGTILTWYGSQTDVGTLTYVINDKINFTKMFKAIQAAALVVPFRVDFYTSKHQTYILSSDILTQQGFFWSAIKNDVLSAPMGTNQEDTTQIWGEVCTVKFTFNTAVLQKLSSIVTKYLPLPRIPTT